MPVDLAITLANAGIGPIDEESLEQELRRAIADRRGYIGEITLVEEGWELELLSPVREMFSGRTKAMAYAWCLIFLMGESGELGVNAFQA